MNGLRHVRAVGIRCDGGCKRGAGGAGRLDVDVADDSLGVDCDVARRAVVCVLRCLKRLAGDGDGVKCVRQVVRRVGGDGRRVLVLLVDPLESVLHVTMTGERATADSTGHVIGGEDGVYVAGLNGRALVLGLIVDVAVDADDPIVTDLLQCEAVRRDGICRPIIKVDLDLCDI